MKNTKDINSLYYFLYLHSSTNIASIKNWRKTIEKDTLKETLLSRNIPNNSIKCDRNQPFCLYNKEENNIEKNKQFLVHKIKKEFKIHNNYYFDEINKKNNNQTPNKEEENTINIELKIEDLNDINISADSLLIERQKHICPEEE